MARKRKSSALLVYTLLLKEVSAQNKLLSEEKKLSLKERRAFIKAKLWPKYKDIPIYKVRLWPLREIIARKLKRVPKKIGCDVTLIDPSQYIEIDYYELDDRLRLVIPQCIYAKVCAGEFGTTKIFNTRDYNYETSGVGMITRNINDWVDTFPVKRKKSALIVYNGVVLLRPKKTNDGTPENYYLELDLYINDKAQVPVPTRVDIPKGKRRKKSKSQFTKQKMREYINSRLKKMRADKSVFKKLRKMMVRSNDSVSAAYKQPKRIFSAEDKIRIRDNEYKKASQFIDRYLKNGKINQPQHARFKKQLKSLFTKFRTKKAGKGNRKKK